MISGIYTITNLVNKKIYVGLTSNFFTRNKCHFKHLKNGTHDNEHLQRSYDKYGKHKFLFEILVDCPIEFLYSEEHYWCNLLRVHEDKYGYNIRSTHPQGIPRMLDVSKQKISKANIGKTYPSTYKPITQYSLDGTIIREWDNILMAAKYFNISDSGIGECCRGRQTTCQGFMWKYKTDKTEFRKSKICRSVNQYTSKGDFINSYKSAKEAAIVINCSYGAIPTAIAGNRMCKGFIWKYTQDYERTKTINKNTKKRQVLCKNNNRVFTSIKNAAEEMNIPYSGIIAVCQNRQTHTHNYIFSYV